MTLEPPSIDSFESVAAYHAARKAYEDRKKELESLISQAQAELSRAQADLRQAKAELKQAEEPEQSNRTRDQSDQALVSRVDPQLQATVEPPIVADRRVDSGFHAQQHEAIHKGLGPAERGLAFAREGAQPRVESHDEIAARWDEVEP
ncbi:MAG: hypothetical protein AAF219_04225 [Myxococcota bacterium]